MHVVTFLMKLKIFNLISINNDEKDDDFQRVEDGKIIPNPSESFKTGKAIDFDGHYIKMPREFNKSRNWMWYIHGIATVTCFVWWLMVKGEELIFAIYIPLDLLLNVSKVAFFWFEYYKHNRNEKKKSELLATQAITAATNTVLISI